MAAKKPPDFKQFKTARVGEDAGALDPSNPTERKYWW
jgi:hypothetical protein